jgi:hypothetical protein
MEAVVHFEKYEDFSPEEIDRLYAEKEALEENQQFVKENTLETLAQVFTNVRYKKEDNITFSRKLLEVLEKQGYMNQ